MIIGFDHIALTSSGLLASKDALVADGYECIFMENDLLNNKMKAKLLNHFRPIHGIAYFRSNGSNNIAIEIVEHGSKETGNRGPFTIEDDLLILRTTNIDIEQEFWNTALRFKPERDGTMTLSSPVPGLSVRIKFVKDANVRNCMLDSPGFTCAAFYTNNIAADLDKVRVSGGWNIIDPFDFTVNGKFLKIAMFRTPGGALCEFIQPVS